MTFNLHTVHFLTHNKLWKFLWYFEIHTDSNFLYDFLVSRTTYNFSGFKLHCLHSKEPLYVFFFSLIFISLLRDRENLYGISKFKSFATWSSFSPYVTLLRYFKFWAAAVSYFLLPLYFVLCTKRLCKFSWNFDIHRIRNLVLFFFSGTYQLTLFWFYVKPISHYGNPLYFISSNLCRLSFALRYRENSHGISTFR